MGTLQLDDHSRTNPDDTTRCLQTEIWYPAQGVTAAMPRNKFSDFLARGVISGSIAEAEAGNAIGGYREGLTIAELDKTWPNDAVRDACILDPGFAGRWPLVIFSHGQGAYRASFIYWTEFLASHGFVVMACDHPGSARYTQLNGKVVKPGGALSDRSAMEDARPKDMLFLVDAMERMANGADSRFTGRVDASNCVLSGFSFGGYATAAALERKDARIKGAVMKCPSLMSAGGTLPESRTNHETPIMMMLATEDMPIGEKGNNLSRTYVKTHRGIKYLMEIKRAGHVSYTSCEFFNPNYGNGVGESKSLTDPGKMYQPLPPMEQHEIANSYGLAFLNMCLRPQSREGREGAAYLKKNHFGDKIIFAS